MGRGFCGPTPSARPSLAPPIPSESAARRFDLKHPAAAEIARLAATLPPAGQTRLERLRGFGGSFGRALTCLCSRVALTDGTTAVLLVATEPAGPSLPLRERVSRLLAGPRADARRFHSRRNVALCDAGGARAAWRRIDAVGARHHRHCRSRHSRPAAPAERRRTGRSRSNVSVAMHRPCWSSNSMHQRMKKLDGAASAAAKTQPIAAPPAEIVTAAARGDSCRKPLPATCAMKAPRNGATRCALSGRWMPTAASSSARTSSSS